MAKSCPPCRLTLGCIRLYFLVDTWHITCHRCYTSGLRPLEGQIGWEGNGGDTLVATQGIAWDWPISPTRLEMLMTFPWLLRRWGRESWGDRRQNKLPMPLDLPQPAETHPDVWNNSHHSDMFTSCCLVQSASGTLECTFAESPQDLWISVLKETLSLKGIFAYVSSTASFSLPPPLSLSLPHSLWVFVCYPNSCPYQDRKMQHGSIFCKNGRKLFYP